MQHENTLITESSPRGGRVSSSLHRHAQKQSEDFTGLEESVNRYDLLILVKRAGKAAGFTSKMIQLLDHYMAFTRDCDWEEGARPIVFQSLSHTALELDVSERQIQYLENALFEAGAISWNDSGNHRRYGSRCPETGRILFAYGVDLTPLAYLRPMLQDKLAEKQLYKEAWAEIKRQISWHRAQVRSLIAELDTEEGAPWQAEYERIAIAVRAHMSIERVRSLLKKHQDLYKEILAYLEARSPSKEASMTDHSSSRDEKNFAHIQATKQEPPDESGTSGRPAAIGLRGSPGRDRHEPGEDGAAGESACIQTAAGLDKITSKQVLNAASPRFVAHIPMENRPLNFADLVEAAARLRPSLGISQHSWADACQRLSRNGAAVCLMLTDRAAQREDDPVRKPAAYFRSLINRAEERKLNLHSSIMAQLKREEGANAE